MFGIVDYILFLTSLILFICIGVYFGFLGSKKKSTRVTREYLFGDRYFKAIPVGLSLCSSAVSPLLLIGLPSEVYIFGFQIILSSLAVILSAFIIWIFILPIFNGSLHLSNPNEYYELRFSKNVRLVVTIAYLIRILLTMPLVLYISCLLISRTIHLPIEFCTTIAGGLCIFYTLIGGYASVIWTDVLQALLMLATLLAIMVQGIIKVGGFNEMLITSSIGQRLNVFNWNPNPFQRSNFWSNTIGMSFTYTAYIGCSPPSLQRFLSLKSEKEGRKSVLMGCSVMMIITIIGSITGLTMYAAYKDCDLVKNKTVENYNELTVNFMEDTIKNIPGMIGLSSVGILSAGLSTLSSEANTISGIIYYDLIYNKMMNFRSDRKGGVIMKFIVLIFGIYCLIMAPFMSKVKYLLQIVYSVNGTLTFVNLSFICLGTTFPKISTRAALSGILVGFIFINWIAIGAIYYNITDLNELPLSTYNCTNNYFDTKFISSNSTNLIFNQTESKYTKEEQFFMYKLSFMFYPLFGLIISIGMAHIFSLIIGFNDVKNVDPKLLIPFVRSRKTQLEQEMRILN